MDTGSSNTWVGAVNEYIPTDSATWTGQLLVSRHLVAPYALALTTLYFQYVEYGSGAVVGVEYSDTVSLGEGLVIKNQSIGSADYAQGIAPYDGILGCVRLSSANVCPSDDLTIQHWTARSDRWQHDP